MIRKITATDVKPTRCDPRISALDVHVIAGDQRVVTFEKSAVRPPESVRLPVMKEAIMTSRRTYLIVVGIIAAIIVTLSAVGKNHGHSDRRPPANEFGPGPRATAQGLYVVTLQGARTLQPRKMYTLQAIVIDGNGGQAVTNAQIAIDGGMPEHGHGLPTRPRVTKNLDNGWYEISGLRFNMGGWWEVKLTITGPAGTDTVTFNLSV